jgi:hypothetical protein
MRKNIFAALVMTLIGASSAHASVVNKVYLGQCIERVGETFVDTTTYICGGKVMCTVLSQFIDSAGNCNQTLDCNVVNDVDPRLECVGLADFF